MVEPLIKQAASFAFLFLFLSLASAKGRMGNLGAIEGRKWRWGVLLTDNTLFDSTQRGELQYLFFVLLDIHDKNTGTFLSRRVVQSLQR